MGSALSIVSINSSGWGPATAILAAPPGGAPDAREAHRGDVVLLQERRLGPGRVAEQEQWCRQVGLHAVIAPGSPSPGVAQVRAASGGTGVAVESWRGMRGPGAEGSKQSCRAAVCRATLAHADAPMPGGIVVGAVYLANDSSGPVSMSALRGVGKTLLRAGKPWILGGDWNVDPRTFPTAAS